MYPEIYPGHADQQGKRQGRGSRGDLAGSPGCRRASPEGAAPRAQKQGGPKGRGVLRMTRGQGITRFADEVDLV